MGKLQRRCLLAILMTASAAVLWRLFTAYRRSYQTLDSYGVEGLGLIWLIGFGLAIACAPAFMQGADSKESYEQASAFELTKLYLLVMGITSTAFLVVFFLLWCLGYLLHFFSVFTQWLRSVTIGV